MHTVENLYVGAHSDSGTKPGMGIRYLPPCLLVTQWQESLEAPDPVLDQWIPLSSLSLDCQTCVEE